MLVSNAIVYKFQLPYNLFQAERATTEGCVPELAVYTLHIEKVAARRRRSEYTVPGTSAAGVDRSLRYSGEWPTIKSRLYTVYSTCNM